MRAKGQYKAPESSLFQTIFNLKMQPIKQCLSEGKSFSTILEQIIKAKRHLKFIRCIVDGEILLIRKL